MVAIGFFADSFVFSLESLVCLFWKIKSIRIIFFDKAHSIGEVINKLVIRRFSF